MRSLILTALLPAALILIPGCKTLELATKAGTAVGVATGQISTDQASSINKSSTAVGRAFDKLTPQQEYFIGEK